jgi:hypothetical protein
VIVYVETNFILELALEREQAASCRQLADWTRHRLVDLRIPAYAAAEAQMALRRRRADRSEAIKMLKSHARDLVRMPRTLGAGQMCSDASEALSISNEDEHGRMIEVIRELYDIASFIPLDKSAIQLAEFVQSAGSVSGDGDLLIFGSILRDFTDRREKGASLFVTRDRGFGARASSWLRPWSCDLITSYDAAVGRLNEALS